MYAFTFFAALALSSLCTASPRLQKRFNGPSDPARFKFYNVPSKLGVICDSDTGPDGESLWYQDLVAATMGQLNLRTGAIREFQIPYSTASQPSLLPGNVTGLQCVVRTGKDGMVYGGAGTRNEIVMVNPRVEPPTLKIFAPPNNNLLGDLQFFNDAWAANQGLFFSQTTGDAVTLFDYKTHEFTNYRVPTKLSGPLGMRTDKYNNLWFTNFVGQYISRLDNVTGNIVEYKNCCPLPQGAFPEVLRSSTMDQKYLWANAFGGNGYIRIEPAEPEDSKKFKIFTNPTGAGTFPFENINDFCGRVWYTSPTFDNLYFYTPDQNLWTTVTIPLPGVPVAGNFDVTMHRGPGHYMWFTLGTIGMIGRYELDQSCYGQAE